MTFSSPAASSPSQTPAERLRLSLRILLGVIFLVVAVLAAAVLWWHYDDSIEQGSERAENLAHILSEHLGRTIAGFDGALVQLSLHSQRVGGPHAPAAAWAPTLKATLEGLTGAGSISVIDENGTIVQSTIPEVVGQSRRDRFLFRTLAESASRGLVADTPYRSVINGHFIIPLGRRLAGPGDRFAGLIAITLEPERLRAFYRSVDTGANGLITVLHPAGQILFQEPSTADPMGREIAANAITNARQGKSKGLIEGELGNGDAHYLTAYRQLEAPPVIVAVSLARASVLADWRREALVTIAGLLLLGAVLALAAWRLGQEIYARAKSQAELAAKVRELESTIAERDRTAAALDEAEARFRVVMDQAPVSVYVKDREGRFTFINRAFETWTGLSAAEVIGKTKDEFLTPEVAAFHAQHDAEVMAKRLTIQREAEVAFPAGKRVALYTKFPITDTAGRITGVGAVAADVTNLKQLESQLLQSQKMEAIGQLTGGIAHDFNNLLTAILLNADILTSRLDPQEALQPLAQTILEAGERGADLTKRLLAFSRRQMLEARPADVNALIVGMGNLMRRTLGEHIAISLVLPPDVRAARIDPGQLETAILNLAVNARDAMPGGGRLTIETANAVLDEAYAAAHVEVVPGPYVMIAVSDTGTGMPADVVARAFDPFFTTKEVGKGTGLGLSMVYGFVKQSNGHVKIYSEAGVGTCVKLYLPCADAPVEKPAAAAAPALPRGSETLLLVEDDRLVRNNTETQLRSLGYTVVTAETPAEAIEKIDQGLRPDLLFTDVVMPGRINGFELSRRLQQRLPGLRVLLTSGYSHGAALETEDEASVARHFLGKPFRRHDLAVKVREALDDAAPG